jgi:hypothetical protein
VENLSVRCSPRFRNWLLGSAGQRQTHNLLRRIRHNLPIADVHPEHFEKTLGPTSPAWELWVLLYEKLTQLQTSRRGGTVATAGKCSMVKRPKLISIYDSRIRTALGVTNSNIWEALWCTIRDDQVRIGLRAIQNSVPGASHLSLLRVLDIVAWMS